MLDKISLFAGLNTNDLETLAKEFISRNYPKNTIVLNQGDETDSLYVIEKGVVKIYVTDDEGKEFILGTLSEKDYFGELALLDKGRRSASVMTLEAARLWIINRENFLNWISNRPDLLMNLIVNLVKRIRRLDEDLSSLALLNVYGRIARILIQRAVVIDNKNVIERLTHQEIACMVGASREMVTRILRDLKQGGYIEMDTKRIIIKQPLPNNW